MAKLRALTFLIAVAAAVFGLSRWLTDKDSEQVETRDTIPGVTDPSHPETLVSSTVPPSGLTLFPGRVKPRSYLRVLVDAPVFETPDEGAPVLDSLLASDSVMALADTTNGPHRWIGTERGYVPAPFVDRIPSTNGDLAPGREGLVAGLVMAPDYAPSDLQAVPGRLLAVSVRGRDVRLRGGALSAFEQLISTAADSGVELQILSGFRSGWYQQTLYAEQTAAKGFWQNVSAPPGRSEHQLGTTADLYVPGSPPLQVAMGETPEGRWLERNVARFGFALTFSQERHEPRGVAYEPWHVRWVNGETREELW